MLLSVVKKCFCVMEKPEQDLKVDDCDLKMVSAYHKSDGGE